MTDGAPTIGQQGFRRESFSSSRQVYECSKWTAGRDVTDMDPLHGTYPVYLSHATFHNGILPFLSKIRHVSAVAPNGIRTVR
jgi:hypothetical protein